MCPTFLVQIKMVGGQQIILSCWFFDFSIKWYHPLQIATEKKSQEQRYRKVSMCCLYLVGKQQQIVKFPSTTPHISKTLLLGNESWYA